MKSIFLTVSIVFLFTMCNQKGIHRDFFKETSNYSNFKSQKDSLPLFGLDSLSIDSLSTSISKRNYWYMSSAQDGLININGYLRCSNKIIYIKVGDRKTGKNAQEQILFDFTPDSTKNYSVKYERNKGMYNLTLTKQSIFYNQLIKDSVVVFKAYSEIQDISFTKEFLLQASLKKGIVSIRYLIMSSKRIYTIDFLPAPKISYENLLTPVYPNQ